MLRLAIRNEAGMRIDEDSKSLTCVKLS